MDVPAWRRYERQITERIRERAAGSVVITPDTTLPGRLSGIDRQVDVLVQGSFAGVADATMIVDCKCFSEHVDVRDVEAFLGMLEDVDVQLGMLVTTKGYSRAAARRTWRVFKEVVPLVDIALFEEAASWWLMRRGSSGRYIGDYVDHEPYGKCLWVVRFATGGDSMDDEEEDVLWSSSQGGWDGDEGSRLLATLLARHRLARVPQHEEIENLTHAIERNLKEGHGFLLSTSQVDDWLSS